MHELGELGLTQQYLYVFFPILNFDDKCIDKLSLELPPDERVLRE